ncbi:MAG: DUF2066 domain-containing protein [Cycloclasticus sp.]|nr:DUF2066 domain-containing protein [Cycloclasticus sp.]
MRMRYFVGVTLFLLSLPLYAVQVEGLYSAKVAVDDQSQGARNRAMGAAINKVVQKVSGRQSVLGNAALQDVLSNAGSYVEQFLYKKRDKEELGYWLIVRFQKIALDRTLQQFNVPVWGSNRPAVLVWLAVDDGKSRYLINADSEGMSELIRRSSSEAGLTVTLPLNDLADQQALSFNDVWAGFSDEVLTASQRYEKKQVMYGRLLKRGRGSWSLSWTLANVTGQSIANIEQSSSIGAVIQEAFAGIAETLADTYAPHGAVTENVLKMDVNGVASLEKFVRVTAYLSSLDMVKKLHWNQLSNGKVTLEIVLSGGASTLKDVIALNTVLIPDFQPVPIIATPTVITPNKMGYHLAVQTLYYRTN